MFIQAKSSISRLLRQSILELCKASVPQGQEVEIDGIVCLSLGDDNDQIVVKVHERLGELCTVSDATSSQQCPDQDDTPRDASLPYDDQPRSRHGDPLSGFGQPIEVTPTSDTAGLGREPAPSGDPQGIRRIATTPIWRQNKAIHNTGLRGLLRPENRKLRSSPTKLQTSPNHTNLPVKVPQGNIINGTTIKTEIESEGEEDTQVAALPVASSQPVGSGLFHSEEVAVDHMGRKADILCEHCQAVCASFKDLKEHNDSAHGAYTCSYCWRSYLHYTNYALHLKRHRATPSRRSAPTEQYVRSSPVIPLSIKSGHRNDKAKCGLCGDGTRTHTTMIQHLKSNHEYEHCFTCPTCLEYFPNRWTFVIHRRMVHGDINQCRCERCDVFFTYVEFKVHERECVNSPVQESVGLPMETEDSQSNIINRSDETEASNDVKNSESRISNTESYINQLLASDDSLKEQVCALKYKVKGHDRTNPVTEQEAEEQLDDRDIENDRKTPSKDNPDKHNESHSENNPKDKSQNELDPKEDPYEDPMAYGYYPLPGALSRSPEESENSLESSKDLSQTSEAWLDPVQQSPCPSTGSGSLQRNPIKSMDHLGAACPGPFRCQNCFQVSEQFEEYEMHCYEMHNRFVCPFCAQSFANKRNLHRHIRKHTGEMPYTCVECGEKFYRDDDLRRHKLSKHSQEGLTSETASLVSNSTGL